LAGACNGTLLFRGGLQGKPTGAEPHVGYRFISPGFFAALGVRVYGREFDARDGTAARKVAIVNESAAREIWGAENPIGQMIGVGASGEFFKGVEVIGVVGDIRHESANEPATPDVYLSYLQAGRGTPSSVVILARTAGDPAALVPAIRDQIRVLDAKVPVYQVGTMETRLRDTNAGSRLSALLLASFSSAALILAAVGIYGVMAYVVTTRTREIGIRMALGAAPRGVLSLVLRQGGTLVAIGLGLGLAGAIASSRLLTTLLFEVSPFDAATYATFSVLIAAVGLAACWIPARRAAKVDPMMALRCE
jgi:putative ABC transport system permease protein